jgi:hypothetical protein
MALGDEDVDYPSKCSSEIVEAGLVFASLSESKITPPSSITADLIDWRPLRVRAERAELSLSTWQYDAV